MKVSFSCVLCEGTFVCPGTGSSSVITGGIVSLAPPLGGVVVFAHECEKIMLPKIISTGTPGISILSILFIFNILQVCSNNISYAFYLLKLSDKLFKIGHVMYIKIYISVKDSVIR